MEIEDQVTSLKLSKRLKELGVKQRSLWHWVIYKKKSYLCLKVSFGVNWINFVYKDKEGIVYISGENLVYCSAFTVAEFGEMLPKEIKTKDYIKPFRLHCMRIVNGDNFGVIYYAGPAMFVGTLEGYWEKTEANARAKMLIYLKENNLIK